MTVKHTFYWTSDASGNATVQSVLPISGKIQRVVFIPSTTASPTAAYDVALNDSDGIDVLAGQGTNLSATATAGVVPSVPLKDGTTTKTIAVTVDGNLTLNVSNAGDSKAGEIVVYADGAGGDTTSGNRMTIVAETGMPSSNRVGIWYASGYDATRKAIPNDATVATVPLTSIVTRNPRGLFDTSRVPGASGSGGWLGGGFDNMTVTEKYAANADGLTVGTRIVFATTANGLRYRQSLSLPAGTYTMVIHAKSNTGASQDFLMSKDGGATTSTKTATTSWQQHKLEFTLGSTTSSDLRFMKPVTGASGDFVIDNAFLWSGNSASVPATPAWGGHLLLGNSSLESVTTTGNELALTSAQAGHIVLDAVQAGTAFTMYATVKRSSAYTTAGAGRYGWLYTPAECTSGTWGLTGGLTLGEYDAEGYLRGNHSGSNIVQAVKSGSLFPAGDTPDLATDGGYHVISMRSDGTSMDLWIDDCCIFITQATASTAMNFVALAVGGNNGLSRHKINSLALYSASHSAAVRRVAIDSLTTNAQTDGISITKPKNLLVGEGDSITRGPATNSYFQQYLANIGGTGFRGINWASLPGSMVSQNATASLNLTTRKPFCVDGLPQSLTGRKAVATFLIGANDLQPVYNSASTFLAAFYEVVAEYRAAGYTVGVATILPKGSAASGFASHNTLRATVNTQLRADVGTQFDFLIDFAANPDMGNDSDANDVAKYGDALHPTVAGHAFLEVDYRAAVNAVLV